MESAAVISSSKSDLVGQHAHADSVQHLMSTAPASVLMTLLGVGLVFFTLQGHAHQTDLSLWSIGMAVLSLFRLVYRQRFFRHFEPAAAGRWKTGYAAIVGLTGLAWGGLVWLPGIDADQWLVLTISLLCVLLIGSSTLIASKSAFCSFSLALVLPLSLAMSLRMGQNGWLFGSAVIAVCALAFAVNRVHFRAFRTARYGHHESRILLQQQRVIFDSAGEGIVLLRPAPEYTIDCNRRFAELLGYEVESMRGMAPWHWHPDKEQWRALVASSAAQIAAGKPCHQSMQLRRADGALFWADVTGMAIDPPDLNQGTVWVVSDISNKRAAEAALYVSEKRFRDLAKISSDIYWEQDQQFRFTRFDGKKESLELMRYMDEHIGKCRWEMDILAESSPIDWADHRDLLERHEPFRDLVYPIIGAEGEKRWLTVSGNPLFDNAGNFVGYHGVGSDITERVANEERYRHMAYHDALTQLPNRRLLEDRLEHAIRIANRNQQRLAVLLVDLNGFKQVNDAYGHAAGDEVLKTTAVRLIAAVRDSDTVARLGGDEFIVLLNDLFDVSHANLVADKIHQALSLPQLAQGVEVRVSASVGIAFYPEHGATAHLLLEYADHAMYYGKQSGSSATRVFDGQ